MFGRWGTLCKCGFTSEFGDGSVDYTDGVYTDSLESNPPNSATEADDMQFRHVCDVEVSRIGRAGDSVSTHSLNPVDTRSAQAVMQQLPRKTPCLDVHQGETNTSATRFMGLSLIHI